jgi:hypothetical protein
MFRPVNISAGRYKRTPTSTNVCKRALISDGAPSRTAHRCRGSAWPSHQPIELACVAPRSFQYISVYFYTFTSQFLADRFSRPGFLRQVQSGPASSSGASGFGVAGPRHSIAIARGMLDRLTVRAHIPVARQLDDRCGRGNPVRGGKSGLHGNTVPANGRRGRPQGKCHRKQTARARSVRASRPVPRARAKRCGKSAPRPWQQGRHGKPHREQDRIGAAVMSRFKIP